MRKFFGITIIFLIIFSNKLPANENLLDSLKKGGKIIFIRHAYAPGNGDPDNFLLNKCSTQRNLNQEGIKQSQKIGIFFLENNIKIDKVLSSEWCRCKETAVLAFNNYKTFSALNSFYHMRFKKNKKRQIKDLKNYIKNWSSYKNLVLVTHHVVILEVLGQSISSGEMIVSDKKFNVIGNFKINN